MITAVDRLVGRTMTVTIGTVTTNWNDQNKNGIKITGNDIEARISRNLIGRQPNTAHVSIWNLAPQHIQALSAGNGQTFPVKIEAGYVGSSSTVFLGNARYVWTDKEGENTITQLRSGDLEEAMLTRAQVPAAPKTGLQDAIQLLAGAMGAGVGNLAKVLPQVAQGALQSVRSGALFGSAPDRMEAICRSAGLEWSIQNGNCQFLPVGGTLGGQVYEVSSKSGMVGSPNVDSKGLLKFETLLLPGLVPGMVVHVNGRYVKGYYRVERCTWELSTFAKDFYQRIEGTAVS